MIANAIMAGLHGEIVPTPEQVEHAASIMDYSGLSSFTRNFTNPALGVPPEEREPVTGSSNYYCSRTLGYKMMGAPEAPIEGRSRNAFFIGDAVHDMVKAQAALYGVPVLFPAPGSQDEFVCDLVLSGNKIHGHVDLIVRMANEPHPIPELRRSPEWWRSNFDTEPYGAGPGEIKSMSSFGFDKTVRLLNGGGEGVENTFGYRDQLEFYMAAMGVGRGYFVGVNKSTGHVLEEEMRASVEGYNRIKGSYASALIAARTGRPPPRPPWATEKVVRGNVNRPWMAELTHVRCGYCNHRAVCWPDHAAIVVSGKPKFRRPLAEAEVEHFKQHKTLG